MNGDQVDVFAGRFAGSFDLSAEDGSHLGHDSEVTFVVQGIVKKVTLEDTRSGEMRLFFVIRPQAATVQKALHPLDDVGGASERVPEVEVTFDLPRSPEEAEEEEDAFLEEERESLVGVPVLDNFEPVGQRVSQVQARSNVAGSSQAERDNTLAKFLYEDRD